MSGVITSIVDQMLGRSRIPEGARPITAPSPRQKRKPKPPRRGLSKRPREQLIDALDDEWRSTWDLSVRARVRNSTAYSHMPALVESGVAQMREAQTSRGVRREYRRAG